MQKQITKIVAVLCAFCGTIYGGQQVFSDSGPPPAPAPVNWTGFYLGAFGSYTCDHVEPELSLGGMFNQIGPVKNALQSLGSKNFDVHGAGLGGLIGFDYQLGNWVIGVETAGDYLWSRGSSDTGAFVLGQGVPPLDIHTSFKTHYLATVAPRIGYAWGRFLPYVTGGLAVGDFDYSQMLRDLADPTAHLGRSISENKVGWMVGGGVQYALTDHWSARVQYQYVDLGSVRFDSSVSNSPQFLSRHNGSLTEHHASFALIYKF